MHEAYRILAWSLRHLAMGVHPTCRHDLTPFTSKDSRRASSEVAGKPLSHHGLLVQIKGDWEFLANKVGLPSWSSTAICGWCRASSEDWRLLESRDCGGRWSLSSEDYFGRLRDEGKAVCPIFAAPAVTRAKRLRMMSNSVVE